MPAYFVIEMLKKCGTNPRMVLPAHESDDHQDNTPSENTIATMKGSGFLDLNKSVEHL
jgi:hypothetical protein